MKSRILLDSHYRLYEPIPREWRDAIREQFGCEALAHTEKIRAKLWLIGNDMVAVVRYGRKLVGRFTVRTLETGDWYERYL